MATPAELIASANLDANLAELARVLADKGVDLELLAAGKLEQVTVTEGTYQQAAKVQLEDGTHEVVVTDLQRGGVSLRIAPGWETGPEWPVVDRAAPLRVQGRRRPAKRVDGVRTAVLLPDTQIHYWVHHDGSSEPFHDPAAMACAFEIAKAANPDVIVHLGDLLDLPEHGRFRVAEEWAGQTQRAIDTAHRWLALTADLCDEVHLIAGNHDERLEKHTLENARQSFNLRPAQTDPESWPALSVPYLLRLDELGVAYVDGWPSGEVWLRADAACEHGIRLSSERRAKDIATSRFFGHTHRMGAKSKTVTTGRDEVARLWSVECGCLCRIDGVVPSYGSGVTRKGRAVARVEDWCQGVVVLTIPDAGPVGVELVPIHDGRAVWRGARYEADGDVVDVLTV